MQSGPEVRSRLGAALLCRCASATITHKSSAHGCVAGRGASRRPKLRSLFSPLSGKPDGPGLLSLRLPERLCHRDRVTLSKHVNFCLTAVGFLNRSPLSPAVAAEWERQSVVLRRSRAARPAQCQPPHSSVSNSYIILRRFPEALRKLEQILNIAPDDIDTLVPKGGYSASRGLTCRAPSALLAPLQSCYRRSVPGWKH